MEKLEQVSDNPDLKEEMEKEVTSTNQVLTQAASWANWAVGAIGAKFYKSANKPPQENKPPPETTEKPKVKPDQQLQKPIQPDLVSIEDDNNAGDGWDNDDDDDWGSLEGPKTTNEITKEDFDSWADDLMSNKVSDKSAIVKQGVQTLQLVSQFLLNKYVELRLSQICVVHWNILVNNFFSG